MKNPKTILFRGGIIWLTLFLPYLTYSQQVVTTGRVMGNPLQTPEDNIGLSFKGADKSSSLKVEVLEFKNDTQIKSDRTKNAGTNIDLSSTGIILLDIYKEANGVVRIRTTVPGEHISVAKIDPDAGEDLKCLSLDTSADIYDKNISIVMIYDSAKIKDEEIGKRVENIRKSKKLDDAKYIREEMVGFLDHYYIITYRYVFQ